MKRRQVIVNSVLGTCLVGAGGLGWVGLERDSAGASQTTTTVLTAARGDVTSSVSGTGNVVLTTSYDVNFDSAVSSNPVTSIVVKVGDRVTKGQTLGTVDNSVLANAGRAAQAQVATAQASLDKTVAGLTSDERAQLDLRYIDTWSLWNDMAILMRTPMAVIKGTGH